MKGHVTNFNSSIKRKQDEMKLSTEIEKKGGNKGIRTYPPGNQRVALIDSEKTPTNKQNNLWDVKETVHSQATEAKLLKLDLNCPNESTGGFATGKPTGFSKTIDTK